VSAGRRAALRGLYAITPVRRDTASLERDSRACLEGGARLLQYRFKDLPADLAREQAERLARACREHDALFIVNDSVALARAVDADGVHLGRDDGDIRSARRDWPEGIIGVSCYAQADLAREAAHAGADYVAIGSVFASSTKPGAVRAPLAAIAQAHDASGLPVAAIGGITPANAREAIEAGAHMLAVIAAVFEAADIRAAARQFNSLFQAGTAGAMHVRP
jgi:thiamine-phosphate pyrophosphorylase